MKSEHRHELAENDLSKLIMRGLKKIEPYQNQILLGMLVITVVIVSAVMLTRTTSAERSAGFAELVMCRTAGDYLDVAEAYEGEVAGQWARLRAGEEYLRDGIRLTISDRVQAIDRLEQAKESFEKLLHDQSVGQQVREKALYGLAMTLESLADDTELAKAAYEKLIEEFPDSRYRAFADDRIQVLGTGRAQQFYAWFEKQRPTPEDRPAPRDLADPFGDIFGSDDGQEPGGLPPPPPSAQRDVVGSAAPDPPADAAAIGGPALPAPGSDAGDRTEGDETTPEGDSTPADE